MAPVTDGPAALIRTTIFPSFWLFAITGSLLLGQLIATSPFNLSPYFLLALAIPLAVICRKGYRNRPLLIIIAGLAFALGYYRHRQLLSPDFGSNHLRSAMSENAER